MEVTKKEILFSIIIFFISLVIALMVKNNVDNSIMETNQVYYSAIKIDNSQNEFQYALKTKYNNMLVYGEFSTKVPVSHKHIEGQYAYIYRNKEEYTRHTRLVKDDEGNSVEEVYYSWDYAGSDEWTTESISFLGSEFSGNKFDYPTSYIKTHYTSSDVRYKYYGTSDIFSASILVSCKTGDIEDAFSQKSIPVYFKTINEVIEYREKTDNRTSIIFWVVWLIVTAAIITVFIYADNYWLNKNHWR